MVMQRIHLEKELLLTIKERKLKYLSHIIRRERFMEKISKNGTDAHPLNYSERLPEKDKLS